MLAPLQRGLQRLASVEQRRALRIFRDEPGFRPIPTCGPPSSTRWTERVVVLLASPESAGRTG